MRLQALKTRALVAMHRKLGTFSNSVMTYDGSALNEGAGAQLHRVLGVFALSRAIGASYFHTPVQNIGYRGVPGTFDPDQGQVLAELRHLAPLSHDENAKDLATRARVVNVRDATLAELQREAGTKATPTLFKVLLPFRVLDRVPSFWSALRDALAVAEAPGRKAIRIAVHVRRGDVHFIDRSRLLPNSYYIGVLRRLTKICRTIGLDYTIDLFSESVAPGTILTLGGAAPGEANRSFLVDKDMDNFRAFDEVGPIAYRINEDLLVTMNAMREADILISSKSSLSMVAGLLQKQGTVLFHPFWHAALPHWIQTSPSGEFDASRMAGVLVELKKRAVAAPAVVLG